MNRHLAYVLALAFFLSACASGQTTVTALPELSADPEQPADAAEPAGDLALDTPLPTDPNVRIDTLDNGLVYYIRANQEPENRAELRLAVDAGSILETEEQQGIAHFVEHMLFNGTCRFPEQELIDFLERTGMRFGPDVNAYTSFDETVYMLQVPTDTTELMQSAFDVLEDWASCATLSAEEIDKERGVVVEEWRVRQQTAQGRMQEELMEVILYGSRYKERLPIGKPEIIREADYETIRSFYEDWYRPGLMAVVAVGDFDPDEIEAMIIEHFSGLESPENAPERETWEIPEHEETLFAVMSDPEMPRTGVTVYYSQEAEPDVDVEDYRELLVAGLFNSMLNQRFSEIAREPDAPFLGAGVFRGSLARPAQYYGLGAAVHEDSIMVGLEAILTEAARVRRHGFTEGELERQKLETLRGYQRAFAERENTDSGSFAREYVANYLEDEPIPGIEYEYDIAQRYVPTITLDEVNEMADDLLQEENRAVFVQMPEKEGLTPPTEEQLASILDVVEDKEIDPYVDAVTDQPLVENVPEPAAIVSERERPEVGVQEVVLANGVTVVMKPTDFKEDEVRFTAFSPGGSSLVSDEELFDAELATAIVNQSGVGPFDRTTLDKMLAGKVVNVSPYIGDTEEGFSGTASPDDLETLFQLIHLYFTAPRADSSAFAALQNQYRTYLLNRSAEPGAAFQDTLQMALYGEHPRNVLPSIELVEEVGLESAYEIYQDRFADASDFTFIFVGNFEPESLQTLAQVYLGSLPSTGREEDWRDVLPDLQEGVTEKTVYKGLGEKSQVSLIFTGDFEYDREHRHRIRSLDEVLSILLREELREELGGTYGVGVSASPREKPEEEYSFSISFSTDPARVDELVEAVWEVIERVKEEGPPAEDVAKVQEQQRRAREVDLESNPFWVSVLDFYYSHEDEPLEDVNNYLEMTEELTSEELQEAAQRYLDLDSYVKVVLYPESYAATSGEGE